MNKKGYSPAWILRVVKFTKPWDGKNESHCTQCKKTVKIGDGVIMVKTKRGKEYKIKFCSEKCFKEYEHNQLEMGGFYNDKD